MTERVTLACPACDSTHIRRRTRATDGGPYEPVHDRWHCTDCETDFYRPVRRLVAYRGTAEPTTGLAAELAAADPEEVGG